MPNIFILELEDKLQLILYIYNLIIIKREYINYIMTMIIYNRDKNSDIFLAIYLWPFSLR